MSGRPLRRMRENSRPVPLDKRGVAAFVERALLPSINAALEALPDDEPIGVRPILAKSFYESEAVDGGPDIAAVVTVSSAKARSTNLVVGGRFRNEVPLPQVSVYLNAALDPNIFLARRVQQSVADCPNHTCLPYSIYSTIIHELTHAFDYRFPQPSSGYDTKEEGGRSVIVGGMGGYVNVPTEVRAFMQQIVDECVTAARDPFVRMRVADARSANAALVGECLGSSNTWRRVGRHFTQANERMVLAVVYRALDQEGLLFS